ncbi:hypothetical protein OAT89_01305 [bacterium]|nr:hypothetical protein [bacterium]
MSDFEQVADMATEAMMQRDSLALAKASEKFLDVFSIHFKSAEWTRFAEMDAGFACLVGFELSHLHLGSEVGMTHSILSSVDSCLATSARTEGLRNRWNLIRLPLDIGNIENDWKNCLVAIAVAVDSSCIGGSNSDEFEHVLFERAGIVTFSLLKELMSQISQSDALLGSVLTMSEISSDTQALLARWMFSESNNPWVPPGFENYMGPSGVSGISPK